MLTIRISETHQRLLQLVSVAALGVTGCVSGVSAESASDDTADAGTAAEAVNPDLFDPEGLATAITEEACTLSSGTVTTCLKVALKGAPSDHAVGPFCPRTVDDTRASAGIWLKDGTVYDVDGAFVTGLASLYGDSSWQLFDEATGLVHVTDTRESCAAAAKPDVDPAFNNYCVECSLDYVDGGVVTTVLIPKHPQALSSPLEIDRAPAVGVALNGVPFDPPAPVGAILAAHTIAAFDDCGGHVNLVAGYHYHAATGCSRAVESDDGHAALIGYAIDGYAIHSMLDGDGNESSDLDACRGHRDGVRGYHYHSAGAGENMFIGCFHGDVVAGADAGEPPPLGGEAPPCTAGQTSRCCGDGTCDGPETNTTCAADCR